MSQLVDFNWLVAGASRENQILEEHLIFSVSTGITLFCQHFTLSGGLFCNDFRCKISTHFIRRVESYRPKLIGFSTFVKL